MNAELNQAVLDCVMATSVQMNDYDQRSALGMARSWLGNSKPIRWDPNQVHYPGRDALAQELVSLIKDADPEDAVLALAGARLAVNAPFVDAGMARFRARPSSLTKPGEKKKAAKEREKSRDG